MVGRLDEHGVTLTGVVAAEAQAFKAEMETMVKARIEKMIADLDFVTEKVGYLLDTLDLDGRPAFLEPPKLAAPSLEPGASIYLAGRLAGLPRVADVLGAGRTWRVLWFTLWSAAAGTAWSSPGRPPSTRPRGRTTGLRTS